MRKVILLVLVVALAVWLVPAASAGPDRSVIFSDCSFSKPIGISIAALDSVWFVVENRGGGFGADAWFPPTPVPIASDNNGGRMFKKSAVSKLLMYSRVPFSFNAHTGGNTFWSTSHLSQTHVDTVGLGGVAVASDGVLLVYNTDTFPCWATVDWPDSVFFNYAASDTVFMEAGYE